MLEINQKYLAIIKELLKKFSPHARVLAYGSRIKNQAHSGSDLDLVIIYNESYMEEVQNFSKLRSAIQNSELPIFVDLQNWKNLPEAFQNEIAKKNIVIQEASF